MVASWFIAGLGGYAVLQIFFGKLNRMSCGVPNPVRCAVALLLLPGALGKAFAPWWPGAAEYMDLIDVLLLGGLVLHMAVDRRGDALLEPRQRTLWRITAIALAVTGGLVASTLAHAEEPPAPVAVIDLTRCLALNAWVISMADVRDSGARRDRHIAMIRKRNTGVDRRFVEVLVREARRVYAHPELDGDELGKAAFGRCVENNFGHDS